MEIGKEGRRKNERGTKITMVHMSASAQLLGSTARTATCSGWC